MKNIINNIKETEHNNEHDPIEKCVICGAKTPYRFSTPIDQRKFYVEGFGQICEDCDYEIYIKKSTWLCLSNLFI